MTCCWAWFVFKLLLCESFAELVKYLVLRPEGGSATKSFPSLSITL
uniref:FBD domain-containing protein n=1 Tax=Setaria viridis TaxID=4556 RepID=A0A4V6D7F9_SETVI|nr:hypothetical protein SEVIR_7G143666v2 [Setaria viridis]